MLMRGLGGFSVLWPLSGNGGRGAEVNTYKTFVTMCGKSNE